MQSSQNPWLKWATLVVPAFAMTLSWPLTTGLPWINRVAVGVAVGLILLAAVHFAIAWGNRRGR